MRAGRKHTVEKDRRAAAAALGERIDAAAHDVFRRHPGLCGFTLRREGDAILADVALSPYAERESAMDVFDDIAESLLELVDENEDSADLLGRTFARTLH